MKLSKIITSIILSLTVSAGALVPALAVAESGSGSGRTDPATKSSDDTTETEHAAEIEQEAEHKAGAARELAKSRLGELKSKVEERSKEVRSKVCENRRSGISNKLDNLSDNGTKHKENFDNVLARIEAFVTKKNLTVENADALKANISTAGDKVATEVATLKALKGTIDCNDPDSVATNLDAFKAQSAAVRDALKEYREAIRAYMKAVKAAAEVAETAEGANQ